MRRGSSSLSLFLGVDKQEGITSHDAVLSLRSIFNEGRCGHCGTLDPAASGVLPAMVGCATRLSAFFSNQAKEYEAAISFGCSTTTDDAEGEIVSFSDVPRFLFDTDFAKGSVNNLVGVHSQVPSAYSAIKVGGRRAYRDARRGFQPNLAPRRIQIFEAGLLSIRRDMLMSPAGKPQATCVWQMRLRVSKGTYIRAIARDLGRTFGVGAHLASLRRTAVGDLRVDACHTLAELSEIGQKAALDPVKYLGFGVLGVDDETARKVGMGCLLDADKAADMIQRGNLNDDEKFCVCTPDRLLAIYAYDKVRKLLVPNCVFAIGVARGNSR